MSLRSKPFWILLGLVSLLAALFSFQYFSRAFPVVHLDIRMDRSGALEQARLLAERQGWGPPGFSQAASFQLEQEVQNFVELEGGGKEAFGRLLTEGLYAPYQWRVRHYREQDVNSTEIRFTPEGTPWGFREQIAEEAPGAALPRETALSIAREGVASEPWRIDLSPFELVEAGEKTQPGGRVDHTFVYERPRPTLGEGRYRLRLVVSGDRLTEVTPFIKIPEGFQRRYQEMRSANQTIGFAASLAVLLLYLLGGCIGGLFLLLRRRRVVWRIPVLLGSLVASLQALAVFNRWPLLWMDYDTALPFQAFTLQQVSFILVQFLSMGAVLSLSFLAAEGLSREAFPGHIQLWKSWSRTVAASPSLLGQTLAGYLLVPIFFAYEVGLYFLTHNLLGWWTPSNTLFEPDVLATYLPWFASIAVSLQAGFWEECLFRAVPLAGAVLLGRRFGRPGIWVAAAFLLQAVIFGAGHAPYPNHPAYARVVELILPSLLFGALYYFWGLLPAIILHFTYDVAWFALPLFVSSAPGIWVDRLLVLFLAGVPLWVVLAARWRAGRWTEVPAEAYNEAWRPPVEPEVEKAPLPQPPLREDPVLRRSPLLPVLGVTGLVLWGVCAEFDNHAPPLKVTRQQAQEAALRAWREKQVEPPEEWEIRSSVQGGPDLPDRLVWQEAGEDAYRRLMGSYLTPPHWRVRFARFEGEVEWRAEEYRFFVGPEGEIFRSSHRLPEGAKGAHLEEEQARSLALSVVQSRYGLAASQLQEVSAEPSRLPRRQDWRFVFTDETVSLPRGEGRIALQIAGDEVADLSRFVFVPEDWERQERHRQTLRQIIQLLSGLGLALFILGGIVTAVISWGRKKFSVRIFLAFTLLMSAAQALRYANRWPAALAAFSTTEPFSHQVLETVGSALLGTLFQALFVGLVAGWVHRRAEIQFPFEGYRIFTGLSLGFLGAGAVALATSLLPAPSPRWADYGPADGLWPPAGPVLNAVTGYVGATCLFLVIFFTLHLATGGWSRRRLLGSGGLLLAGLVLAGPASETFPSWILTGSVSGLLLLFSYLAVLRRNLELLPLATLGMMALGLIREGVAAAYPGAEAGTAAALLLLVGLGLAWSRLPAAAGPAGASPPAATREKSRLNPGRPGSSGWA